MKYELKAMGVGEIFDESIRVFKDHFGLFLKILLCFSLPVSLVLQLVVVWITPTPPARPTPQEAFAFAAAQMRTAFIFLPFALLYGLTVVPFTHAAIMHATARLYFGKTTSIAESFRVGLSRLGPLLWTWFLVYLFVAGGTIFFILPGILLMFRYALAANIAVLEEISGMAALRRSRELMVSTESTHYIQFFLIGLNLFVILGSVTAIARLIPDKYAAAVVQVLVQQVVSAFALVPIVVFYFSCRCRVENFDLLYLTRAVGETTPAIPTEGALPADGTGIPH